MNPSTGSFTTMDSYQGSLYEPISLHKYAYANANPISYADPSGYSATNITECAIVQTIQTNINEIVQIQSLKRVMNWANAACTAYDVITLTMSAMLDDAELGYIIFSICKGVAIGMLINCILASTSSVVLKAIFATKGIKDQHELIMDAIEEGNPWLVALRIMQMFSIVFGIVAQCFTGETLVVTDEGLVAIEDIEVGDYVLAEDTETGEKEYKEVKNVYVSQTNKLVHVTTADDNSETTINTTDNHPFYVEGKGWVPAIELEAGDELRTADGSIEVVTNVEVEYLDEAVIVYNLEVEGYHTYFVSDESVLVHNGCESDNPSSRREAAEKKAADAANGSQAEGTLIGKDGDVPVYQSQQQLKDSITDAGAQYIGPTRNSDGQIYHMDTPYGAVEIRIMQQKPGQTNPYLDNRTIIVEQGSVGNGTGIYTYGNGAPIRGNVSISVRKAIGHTHGQIP